MRNTVARVLIVNAIVFFVGLTPFGIVNVNNLGYVFEWFALTARFMVPLV